MSSGFVMSRRLTLVVDVAVWGLAHAVTGYAAHRLDRTHLDHSGPVLRAKAFEDQGRWYRHRLHIHRWKDRLPEAGALFTGGVSKRALPSPGPDGLALFVQETRRAELAHWWAMLCGPVFVLWNPRPIAGVLIGYGVAVNLPFIAIQRYNRFRTEALLDRRTGRGA